MDGAKKRLSKTCNFRKVVVYLYMKNTDRRLELSGKFIEMGQALIAEGNEKKDFAIIQSGTFLILASTIILSDEDSYMFGELCSMFNSKKIIDNEKNNSNSYDEFLKRINDIRNGDKKE